MGLDKLVFLLSTIRITDVIDIFIVSFMFYKLFALIRGTRATQLIKGILFIFIGSKLSEFFKLYTISWILNNAVTVGFIAILIVFQPELRRILEHIGNNKLLKPVNFEESRSNANVIEEIVKATYSLAGKKIGALMVLERKTGLRDIIETGISLNSDISYELLMNIFIPNTPLHDGAVVISNDHIIAASCFLPLTDNKQISMELGTRHRAGIGISEKSDAIVIVVSEETGYVSICEKSKINRNVSKEYLLNYLVENFVVEEKNTNSFKEIFQNLFENKEISKESVTKEELKEEVKKEIIDDIKEEVSEIVENQGDKVVKKDFKLKLISLSVGIVMWFLVIGGVNPVVTRQFTDVPVSFKNQSVLESRKLIRVSPENPTVTVTITGKRSDVYSVNKSDIVAEVNLQNGITSGAHRLSINYKVPYNVQFKSASDNDLLVTLDEEISKTYKVEVETIGQIKNKNQVVAKKEPADSEVVVKGPVSYVNKVKRVRCVVDVTNKDGDEVVQSKIVPVDELNKEVKKVSLSKTDTNVSIGFKNFKEVPIKLVEINSPPSDVRILKKDIVPNIISIVGNLTSLEQISQINTKPFDLSQIKESGSYNLNLELPSDVTLVNNDLKVVINIDVDKKIEKTLEIDTSNIEIENESGKDILLKGLQDKVKVTVRGYESDLAKLNAEDIRLYISVKKEDVGKNVQIKAKNI